MIGEEELSEPDRRTLDFGGRFEHDFLRQGPYEDRSIEETLDRGWNALRALPKDALSRIRRAHIERYLGEDPA